MRRLCSAFAIALLLPAAALAQSQIKSVGVFSVLGDAVQVVAATDAPSDTRIERSARETMEFKDIGFDIIATREARLAIERAQPQAKVELFRSPTPQSLADQRLIADGATRGELPDWMVQIISARPFSHVLVILRSRGDARIRVAENAAIGRGTLDGIGFYLDTLYRMRNVETGALSEGLIAPYLQLRLILMDTQTAQVVASHDVRDAQGVAAPDANVVADPWTFMSAKDKVTTLREMVARGVARGVDALLAAR